MSTGQIATADYMRFSLTYGSPVKVRAPKFRRDGWDRECRSLEQGGAVLHAANTLAAVVLLLFTGPLLAILAIAVRLAGPGPVLTQARCRTRFRAGAGQDAAFGRVLRRCHLHELPVLFDMLEGEFHFGPRRPVRAVPAGPAVRQPGQLRPVPELV